MLTPRTFSEPYGKRRLGDATLKDEESERDARQRASRWRGANIVVRISLKLAQSKCSQEGEHAVAGRRSRSRRERWLGVLVQVSRILWAARSTGGSI